MTLFSDVTCLLIFFLLINFFYTNKARLLTADFCVWHVNHCLYFYVYILCLCNYYFVVFDHFSISGSIVFDYFRVWNKKKQILYHDNFSKRSGPTVYCRRKISQYLIRSSLQIATHFLTRTAYQKMQWDDCFIDFSMIVFI